ncbi:F-box/LRR-repeat protein 17-like [Arachis ipaensis]|uniref:F-box/LRR-repeat protein 17-like n=1 Tax=Arachis ipaensis TaxID=130454 RepID=UPI000A2B8317|nr:F-box/LRR-repeat protein 17-like [Arachis ipaensis]
MDLLKLSHSSRARKEGGEARPLFVPPLCTSWCCRVASQPPRCRRPQPSPFALLYAARTHPLPASWGLRMLSLVAAIASSYPNVELLDLSGSGRSDSGIGIICNVFPETLSRLLLALCPNVTSSGIQFATAQLLLLELMDCGMTIRDPDSLNPTTDEDDFKPQETFSTNMHLTNQKLIIKQPFKEA